MQPDKMTFGSLFAGIGGFDLGLERAGMECHWQCEIDPFCQKVLAKHWPDVKRYEDIKNVRYPEPVDLICGGFPCQPFSCAGKRGGSNDDRFLWPEMLRVISEVRSAWVLAENVAGIIRMELDRVLSDLEGEGYETQTFVIPACAVNAPHRRDRVWIVAHAKISRRKTFGVHGMGERKLGAVYAPCTDRHATNTTRQLPHGGGNTRTAGWGEFADGDKDAADTSGQRLQRRKRPGAHEERQAAYGSTTECNSAWDEPWIEAATRLCGIHDGVPGRVDRLKSLGNAVVPQIVEVIGKFIREANDEL